MADVKLKDIVVKTTDFKYEDCDFSNRTNNSGWPVHRIFEEVYFNEDEAGRKKIEEDVRKRGDGKLLERYLDAMKKVSVIDGKNITYFHTDKTKLPDEDKYFMQTNAEAYAKYAALFENAGIYDLIDLVKTQQEAEIVLEVAPWVSALSTKVPDKYIDTNASRRGILTQQAVLKDLRKRLTTIFEEFLSQKASNRLKKGLIDFYIKD